jgi:cephalosporin-C deacetylase-like acetyl esterase
MHSKSKHSLRCVVLLSSLAFAACAEDLIVFRAPGESPDEQLTRYLNRIGLEQLRQREAALSKIATRDEFERRKKEVRAKILRLIGGLPEYRGPLNTKSVGTLDRGDYRIEKIIYESLPGFYVPANVYVPTRGAGPFPAILMPVGHSAEGKEGERQTAIGLARKGFIALKYDPIGQGERLQYYDPDLRASKVGGPTTEHTHANGHTHLIGENVARYRIWDGMRGIDYLLTRKDVDANRIGCTGCSGGGTLTTYISALDDRVKVAAPACYITSWRELLPGPGPQDAEQSFPGFLAEGLDIADYIGLFAPKPWLSASTIQDFFPLEGARQTYEEAQRIYDLYGARDRIGWYVGPGGHGVPQPSREALYAWFIKWLKNGEGDARETPARLDPLENILCTKTGQVSDSLGGETVFTLNRKRAAEVIPARQPVSDPKALRSRLIDQIRTIAAVSVQPRGAAPQLTVHRSSRQEGYRLDVVSYESERGIRIPGLLLIPEASGAKPAFLVTDSRPKQTAAGGPAEDLETLAKAGYVVFAIQPRGTPEIPPAPGSRTSGHPMAALRASVVGKNLTGMRVDDIIRAVDYLSARPDVDRGRIRAFGYGALGVPLLHAAVLDDRIGGLVLQQVLARFRLAVERPIHRNLYEVSIPGVLRSYDLDELLAALSPRPVTIANPVDTLERPMRLDEFRSECRYALDAPQNRIRVVHRLRGDTFEKLIGE